MAELRKYRPEDFDRLLEIDHACFVEGIAYSKAELRYFLGLSSASGWVATEDREIMGFIIADRHGPWRSSRFAGRIITIDVLASARHSGVGTLLLTTAEKELQQAGCSHVVLEVAVNNDNALRFYKKHGYSVLKALPRYYLDSIDGLLMGKKL